MEESICVRVLYIPSERIQTSLSSDYRGLKKRIAAIRRELSIARQVSSDEEEFYSQPSTGDEKLRSYPIRELNDAVEESNEEEPGVSVTSNGAVDSLAPASSGRTLAMEAKVM
jgi:hypothetical protein